MVPDDIRHGRSLVPDGTETVENQVERYGRVGQATRMEYPDPWPLDALVLRTPQLELRPDDDAGLRELVAVAYDGVHPPEQMPFSEPWTEADPRDLGHATMQFHWRQRAALGPQDWTVQFLVRLDGRVIGVQSLCGTGFGVRREVSSGSWLGLPYQRRGLGTEMRAAVLALAFDHLGAWTARSAAFLDNPASRAVSRRLGYREDGTETCVRRSTLVHQVRLLLSSADFQSHRPEWPLHVAGLDGCRALLGADQPAQPRHP
jgi:RimJ/RimL family protein N-acetyltransferase